jgi:epoxyqueuosine reductase
MGNLEEEIASLLPNRTDYIIGYADLGNLLNPVFAYRYAVVIGKKLDDDIIDSIENGPTPRYLELYHQSNQELNALAASVGLSMDARRIKNTPINATIGEDELDERFFETLRLKYSHKMGATRAGMGWIGKTDLLISAAFGPRLRMSSVLTEQPFETLGTPINESKCGDCDICVKRCPAQAANGKSWNISVDREAFYDAFKCMAKCRELTLANTGKPETVCGICVSVCPKGRRRNRPVINTIR